MTKERFIELMETITRKYGRQINFIGEMNNFCSDNFLSKYFEADFLISYLDFIEEIITGKKIKSDGYLMGCVIECNCNFSIMDFFDDSGDKIPKDWGDVYEFLINQTNDLT